MYLKSNGPEMLLILKRIGMQETPTTESGKRITIGNIKKSSGRHIIHVNIVALAKYVSTKPPIGTIFNQVYRLSLTTLKSDSSENTIW